jgi:NAD(P)-dependent dehydrogenase (short-subunit alcohol dehydrogenase family)
VHGRSLELLDKMSKTILDRFRLDGRVALITGAGQGIGKAFAVALGEAGAKIAVTDLNRDLAHQVANELLERDIDAIAIAANVADPESIKVMVSNVLDHFGRLDIAFNNAGVNKNSAAEETPLEEWDQTFAVNLRGLFLCCQVEGRHVLKSRVWKNYQHRFYVQCDCSASSKTSCVQYLEGWGS